MWKKVLLLAILMIGSGSLNANMQPGHKNWEKTVKDGAKLGAVVGGVAAGVTVGLEGIGVVAVGTSVSIAPLAAGAVAAVYVGTELVHYRRCQKRCSSAGSDKFARMMGEVFSVIHQENDNPSLKEWFQKDLFHNKENDAAACILKCSHYFHNMDFIKESITKTVLLKEEHQESIGRSSSVNSYNSTISHKSIESEQEFNDFLEPLRQSSLKSSKLTEEDFNLENEGPCLNEECSKGNCKKKAICPKVRFIGEIIGNIKIDPSLKPVFKNRDTVYERDSESSLDGVSEFIPLPNDEAELPNNSEFIHPANFHNSDEVNTHAQNKLKKLIKEEERNSDTLLTHIVIKEEEQKSQKKSWVSSKIKNIKNTFQSAWGKIYPSLKQLACDNFDKIVQEIHQAAKSNDSISSWVEKLKFLDDLAKKVDKKYAEKIKERIKKMGCQDVEKS